MRVIFGDEEEHMEEDEGLGGCGLL